MATTQHFMERTPANSLDLRPAREMSVASVARSFTRLIAAALVAAALGLWVAPGSSNLPELMLMKLCASFFLGLTGLHLFFASRNKES